MKSVLSQHFYFSTGENVPSGELYSAVVEKLGFWGNRDVQGFLWQGEIPPQQPVTVTLGTTDILEKLHLARDRPVCGGLDSGARVDQRTGIRETEFSFGCYAQSSWFGIATMAYSSLVLCESWVRQCEESEQLAPFLTAIEVMDKVAPAYGCLDVSSSAESQAGLVFGSIAARSASLSRISEHARWLAKTNAGEAAVRGVFWGNYLNNRILEILDKHYDEGFVNAYRKETEVNIGEPTAIVKELSNGVFITVGRSPLEHTLGNTPELSTQLNAIWLTNAMVRSGLL